MRAGHRTGFGDDRALDHARMTGEHRFDLGGIDLQAAAVDHVLLAIEHTHEIVGVDRAEVAGMPEAAGKAFGRRLRIVPIALDDLRAADPYLADLAVRQFA